jgi:hypothetical protein
VSFLVTLVIDQWLIEGITIAVKIVLFPWIKKETQDENGYLISHLLLFLVAVPEMNEFMFKKVKEGEDGKEVDVDEAEK